MAKNKKETIILEDVELRPQVIGHTYKKKSNLGRVFVLFIIFLGVVYFINDITFFINNLLGKKSSEAITDNLNNSTNNKDGKNEENINNNANKEYLVFSSSLEITFNELKFNNFKYEDNKLSFDVTNSTQNVVDISSKKVFLETYSENKTLLERYKLDFDSMASMQKQVKELTLTKDFYYIAIEEKTVDDYPYVSIDNNTLTCMKNNNIIEYTFNDSGLTGIKDTYSYLNTNSDYNMVLLTKRNEVNSYNGVNGYTTSINETETGFTRVITINLASTNSSVVKEKYYYKYGEQLKVVNFETSTYGYTCN